MNWKNAAPLLASRSLHTSVTMGLVVCPADGAHRSTEARKTFAKVLEAEIKDAQSDDEPLPEAFGDFKVVLVHSFSQHSHCATGPERWPEQSYVLAHHTARRAV